MSVRIVLKFQYLGVILIKIHCMLCVKEFLMSYISLLAALSIYKDIGLVLLFYCAQNH